MAGLHDKPRVEREQDRRFARIIHHDEPIEPTEDRWETLGTASQRALAHLLRDAAA